MVEFSYVIRNKESCLEKMWFIPQLFRMLGIRRKQPTVCVAGLLIGVGGWGGWMTQFFRPQIRIWCPKRESLPSAAHAHSGDDEMRWVGAERTRSMSDAREIIIVRSRATRHSGFRVDVCANVTVIGLSLWSNQGQCRNNTYGLYLLVYLSQGWLSFVPFALLLCGKYAT